MNEQRLAPNSPNNKKQTKRDSTTQLYTSFIQVHFLTVHVSWSLSHFADHKSRDEHKYGGCARRRRRRRGQSARRGLEAVLELLVVHPGDGAVVGVGAVGVAPGLGVVVHPD
jgi:hypothetical protein